MINTRDVCIRHLKNKWFENDKNLRTNVERPTIQRKRTSVIVEILVREAINEGVKPNVKAGISFSVSYRH